MPIRSPLFYKKNPGSPDTIVDISKVPGNIFYVDSTQTTLGGDTTGHGFSPDAPFLTLAYAITQCTANKGDTIYVMPGHTENVASASAITFSVAGIRVIGLGYGSLRPTFNFITSTAATIVISANNVQIENILLVNGIDALARMLTISGADCKLQSVEVRDNNASFQVTNAIVTTAAADRLQILDHIHRAGAGKTGAATQISIVGGDGIVIRPRMMDGDCSTANIQNVTTAATSLRIFGDPLNPAYLRNRGSTKVCITLVSTSTGQVGPHIYERISGAGASNITNANVGAAMDFYQPISIVNTGGTVGLNTTITASANS